MAKLSVVWVKYLCISICLAAVLASALKSFGLLPHSVSQIEHWVGGDKPLHMLVAFACSFAVLGLTLLSQRSFYHAACLLLLAFSLDEGLQLFSPYRQFSWFDLLANYTGLTLALLLIMVVSHYLQRQQGQANELC